eukprot:5965_2
MFDEILKFGSYIVDELVGYKQPVLVYIPRHAELRRWGMGGCSKYQPKLHGD